MSIYLTVAPIYTGPRCGECGQAGPDHTNPRGCVDELKRQVANGARIIRDLSAELRATAPAYSEDGDRRASPPPPSSAPTPAERLANARAAACDLAVAAGVLLIECEELAAIPGEHVAGADALRRVAVIITDEVAIALPRGGS